MSVDLSGKPGFLLKTINYPAYIVCLELACETPACFGPLKSLNVDEYEETDEPNNKMHLNAYERTAVYFRQ
jgi:hypothetical protein